MSPVEESPEEFLARFAAHRVEVRRGDIDGTVDDIEGML